MKQLLQNECGNAVVAQLPVARLRKQEVGVPSKRISPQNRTPTPSPTLTSDPDPPLGLLCVSLFSGSLDSRSHSFLKLVFIFDIFGDENMNQNIRHQ